MESSIKTNKTKEVNTQHLGVTDIVDGMSYCVSKLLFFNVLIIMRQHLLQKSPKTTTDPCKNSKQKLNNFGILIVQVLQLIKRNSATRFIFLQFLL